MKRRTTIAKAVEARKFSPRMKQALLRALDGESYRKAAGAEGVHYADLNKNAARVEGLREAHLLHPSRRRSRAWKHQLARECMDLRRRSTGRLRPAPTDAYL